MNNVAVIPARGGSKGIPRKNIRLLGARPLIAWSIDQALQSSIVTRVIVSTDCPEIAQIAKEYGADVPFLRPPHLAYDNAATEPTVIHAIEWLFSNERYVTDNVVLLQPTSPIRTPSAIDSAYQLFIEQGADSLLSVCQLKSFLWRNGRTPDALYDYSNRPRRQDIDENQLMFQENGSIYITNSNFLKKNQNRLGGKIALFEMSDHESIDIDTELDWTIVEAIAKTLPYMTDRY